jgi:4-amino-4-deoxy-L-arabinose transferase-like glycosyltransferase
VSPDGQTPPPARAALPGPIVAPSLAPVLAPILAALVLRLACLALLGGALPQLGDANGYLYLAREFRWKGNFSWMSGGVRPPLHRVLLAPGLDHDPVPDDVGGAAPDAYPGVYLIQIAMDVAMLAMVMALTRRRFGRRAAIGAGWLYALLPQGVLFASAVVLAEVAAGFLTAGALLVLDRLDAALEARRGRRGAWLAAGLGVALGAGILVKEIMLPVTGAVVLALLLRTGRPFRERLQPAALAGGVALLVALPWGLHNLRLHDAFILSGTYGDYSMSIDNAPPGTHGIRRWHKQPDLPAKLALARRTFRDALFEYPALTAQRSLVRLRIALGPEVMLPTYVAIPYDGYVPDADNNFDLFRDAWVLPAGSAGRRVQVACGAGAWIFLALAAAGLCARPRGMLALVAVVMTATLFATLALTVAAARYRHGLVPFLLPFAGLGLALAWSRVERAAAGRPAAGRALVGGAAAALLLLATLFLLPAP